MTVPRRFELLSCSLKRPCASMKMSNFERKYSSGFRHMICFGKTKIGKQKRPNPVETSLTPSLIVNFFVSKPGFSFMQILV